MTARKAASAAAQLREASLPESPIVRWFRPADLRDELFLSGPCELAISTLTRELRHVPRFLEKRIDPPSRVLFGGPSGAGKTLAARWIGRRLDLPVAVIDIGAAGSSLTHQTGANLSKAFNVAASVPSILFLDETDAICRRRDGDGSAAANDAAHATTVVLQQLDMIPATQIVFAATNFPDDLDPALARRFTTHITFALPDASARRSMITRWLASVPAGSDTFDRLTEETDGMSGAETRSHVMAWARALVMREAEQREPPEALTPLVGGEHARFAQELFSALDRIPSPGGPER